MKKVGLIATCLVLIAFAIGLYTVQSQTEEILPEHIKETVTEPTVQIFPENIKQGEPALISVLGLPATSTVASIQFDGKEIGVFILDNAPSAFIGIDLKAEPGAYDIIVSLSDGTQLKKELLVGNREIVEAPLGIPDKLGGNTPQGEANVISSLAEENRILASVSTVGTALWGGEFTLPLMKPVVVTDDYGYTRLTGASTISHKGTDFRAAEGTRVMAMNSGVVRLARTFTVYGNTIIIDHGHGLQTLYMHLSEIDVKVGDAVEKGQVIGKSGMTGYAEQPHLHLSIRIDGISIDPMKFIELIK